MFAKTRDTVAKESKEAPSSSTKAKSEESMDYEARVAKHKKDTLGLSPLQKHIFWVLDEKFRSSGKSVKEKLEAMKGSAAFFKGPLIHKFNATQRGAKPLDCPFLKTTDLRSSLHLGTTRVWDHNGMIDEARWEQLVKYTVEKDALNNDIITLSKLKAYLAVCAKEDPVEKDTGRHDQSEDKGNSRGDQEYAAVKAWEEVYDRLKSGVTVKGDPFMLVSTVREFHEDSPLTYLRAECGLLPLPSNSTSTHCCIL